MAVRSTRQRSALPAPVLPQAPHHTRRPCILLALGWYSAAIHRGIARYARRANWVLDLSMTRNGLAPRSWRGDGIICLLHWEAELYEFVKTTAKPVVNIGDVRLPNIPTVHADNAAIGNMAAEHFIARGFRNVAFFRRSDAPSATDRSNALRARVEQNGGVFYFIDWLTHNKGRREHTESELIGWLGKQLKKLPKPLAVFSEHDEVSIEVIYACQHEGIPVPEQVAVLGVDDDKLRCEFAPIPLSSIDNNQEMEGYEAAALLDRLLHDKPAPATPVLVQPIGITTRLSTDILAVKHPHVAAALLHIWQNYKKPINAKTVASTVSISYRRLHDAFLENIGRTIADEITWKRMEHAKKLLVETNRKAGEIAVECGFPNDDRMGRIFKRELGMTPIEYRQQNRRLS
ncbi:transcriptional regulator [Opitutaceae bacterium TAV1]|nr:transcriptional regulator [Opitutaceae bacterium TAV1]